MAIATINPATGELIKAFEPLKDREISAKLDLAQQTFMQYRQTSFVERSQWLQQAADILIAEKTEFAQTITLEMGKPWKAAIAEVEKCAAVCRYYAENAANFLADLTVKTDASLSFISYQPLGIIKHASNVPQCALAIEEIIHRAGFPTGVFQTLLISAAQVAPLIDDQRVKAATLTGSEFAGASLAAAAGKQIKKTVLELGGSDPFIVLESADLITATAVATTARMVNNGQSCIAAKRFIVAEAIADKFTQMLLEKFRALKIGDPMEPETDLGPLATPSILQELAQQVQTAVESGGKVLIGGQPLSDRQGYFFQPTLIVDIPTDAPIAQEEFFGPVALLFRVPNIDTAINLANATPFGLGASAWTTDVLEQKRLIAEIEAGCVFINSMVKSDPRLPFGGTKRSGYGRELSIQGLHEFVNVKTVWIK
jgi:succinate-semialdehyde dehydrogenase/glutarate-semialdehyde dehydrogenase